MELSAAEQAAFFGTFGQQLEALLIQQFGSVERRLQRLEFLQEARKPLTVVRLILELERPLTPEELGHYRLMVEIMDLSVSPVHPTLLVGARDAYATEGGPGGERLVFAYKQLGWTRSPDEELQDTIVGIHRDPLQRLLAVTGIHQRGPFHKLGDLEGKALHIYMTEQLATLCSALILMANSYVLFAVPRAALDYDNCAPLTDWPWELGTDERNVKWKQVYLKADPASARPWQRLRPFSLDFDQITPRKVAWGSATF